jgi:plastocyanin
MVMKKLMFVPLAALALAGGGVASAATASTARSTANVVTLTAPKSGLGYDKKVAAVTAGKITLVFNNLTTHQHNISLEQGETEYGATVTIGKGTTASILTLAKGTYHYYSSFGNDENHGFSGTLTVS